MKKNPYQIQSFLSVGDFPAKITKAYAYDALKIIQEEINSSKIQIIKADGEYLKAMQANVEKFERFKKFIQSKLKIILDEEFTKLTGVSKTVEDTVEDTVKDTEKVKKKVNEKPKKQTRKKKTTETVVEKVKEVFTNSDKGEIE
jgi:hypothetical protein